MSKKKPRTEDGGHGGITTVWEISTYPTFNLKKGHDRHGASLQTHPNKQLPFKTHPISSLRVHRALRAMILLLGFAIKPSSQPHHLAGEQRIGEKAGAVGLTSSRWRPDNLLIPTWWFSNVLLCFKKLCFKKLSRKTVISIQGTKK